MAEKPEMGDRVSLLGFRRIMMELTELNASLLLTFEVKKCYIWRIKAQLTTISMFMNTF